MALFIADASALMGCVNVFTIALSLLCGFAANLPMLIYFASCRARVAADPPATPASMPPGDTFPSCQRGIASRSNG